MPRIDKITAYPVAVPLRTPMKLASEVITAAENLVVHVVDSDGIEGWGEAASAPTMTGELLPGMVAAVQRFIAPALLGQPADDLDGLGRILRKSIRANSGAKAAVDIALHDLVGKRREMSVSALLGEVRHESVPVIRMISPAGPGTLSERASEAAGAGYTHFKLKVGAGVAQDADNVAKLRDVIGMDRHLSADANMGWTAEEALEFLDRVAGFDLAYLEQPVADDDVTSMAAISARTPVPLCIDEALHGPQDIVAHAQARAAVGAGIKLIKLAGYAGAAEAERLAREAGWNTTYASKIAETSIGAAATLHAAARAVTVDWGVSITTQYLEGDIAGEPVAIREGVAAIPSGSGLGVSVDSGQLDRYRLDI